MRMSLIQSNFWELFMTQLANKIFLIAAFLFASQALAGEIKVSNAWARATAPGQEVASVGLNIRSKKNASLIAVSSTLAESAEIHTMTMDDGIMRMRQLENLELTPNQDVILGPGGNHLMLFGLKHALKAGEQIPLTLTFKYADQRTEQIKISARIEALNAKKK
jgi:periplasmic copper chaperone A